MRKDLDHLPEADRLHLQAAVRTIRHEFALAMRRKKRTTDRPRRILKIVLYGSMARGTPVRDAQTGYTSDFDLLVIVSDPDLADPHHWEGAADALLLDEEADETRWPTRFIVHDLDDVNTQLHLGRPFFKDICRDGIVVYEFSKRPLAKPGNLTAEEVAEEAGRAFEQWFPRAEDALWGAAKYSDAGKLNWAAFLLHQAIESAYHCVLQTLTLYSPKQHDIVVLRGLAEGMAPDLIPAWPRRTYYERRPFNRLVRAYVEARYSPHYEITVEDLATAAEQVAKLHGLVKAVCERRLAELG